MEQILIFYSRKNLFTMPNHLIRTTIPSLRKVLIAFTSHAFLLSPFHSPDRSDRHSSSGASAVSCRRWGPCAMPSSVPVSPVPEATMPIYLLHSGHLLAFFGFGWPCSSYDPPPRLVSHPILGFASF